MSGHRASTTTDGMNGMNGTNGEAGMHGTVTGDVPGATWV
jgi:hypothetical protein